MLRVSCPKCKHFMNCEPRAGLLSEKTKRCVYCGHSFKIHSNPTKTRITKIVK